MTEARSRMMEWRDTFVVRALARVWRSLSGLKPELRTYLAGIVSFIPSRMALGFLMLFAFWMAATETPYLEARR